jgi:hypothetical protein
MNTEKSDKLFKNNINIQQLENKKI